MPADLANPIGAALQRAEVCQTCARKEPTTVTRGITPTGGIYAPTRKPPFRTARYCIGPSAGLTYGGLEKNGGCPRNRVARRPFDILNRETAFWDCNHWSEVPLATAAVAARERNVYGPPPAARQSPGISPITCTERLRRIEDGASLAAARRCCSFGSGGVNGRSVVLDEGNRLLCTPGV